MQKEYVDDMSLSLSDLDHLNETFFFPLQSVYLALNAYGTYYDLKQKSSVYLQKTLVFTKEREEVEKIAAAEAKTEAEKTVPPLSKMLLMNRRISKSRFDLSSLIQTTLPTNGSFPHKMLEFLYHYFLSQLLQLRLTGSYLSIFKFRSARKRQKIAATAPECCIQAHPCPKRKMQHR